MIRSTLFSAAMLASALPLLAAAPATKKSAKAPAAKAAAKPAAAPTVDQLVQNHIQAMGGSQAFKAIQTMRIQAKILAGPGMEMPMGIEIKKPGKVRVDMTIMGQSMIQVVNGKDSWMINPMSGSTEPTPMPADVVAKTEDQATQFEGPLVNYKERGSTLELLGKEKQEASEAYKLKLVDKNGQETTLFMDADSYLLTQSVTRVKANGQDMNVTVKLGDYKPVGGILISHALDIQIEGMPMSQRLTMEKVEVNPVLEDTRFEMPKKAPAAVEAPKP